jgi:F-type H+-transporting ATPase subunit b
MIAEAGAQAAGEAEKRNVELGEALSKRIADAEAAIDKARQEALGSLNEAAADVAAAATDRLIGESPDRDTVSAAVLVAAKGRA